MWKNDKKFSQSNKVPFTTWHSWIFPDFLDILGKNCFVKIFSHFSKKNILMKNVSSLKQFLDLDIFSPNQLNISIKRAFRWNFYFCGKFFSEKWGKILTKQFFFYISKQVAKISISNFLKMKLIPIGQPLQCIG